eukprot:TRINITY_DN4184_c0_g1_i1.p1 TRINITY_DN4184_c0_g1~~TRINITY_DN4184_c0_g1_i1.p1  ORF type:complete len:166 (-),score=55.47 TRINITY_DN4184_c0_g1_i1:109-606(-)
MFVLYLALTGLVSVSLATPVGPKSAGVALAGLALATKLAEDECDDVGIEDNLCAVLYDEEKCKRSSSYISLRNGDEGVLPLFTTGLRRNDVESLIVRYRCKLELWDDDKGLEKGAKPDLVIDRSSRTNLGRNKYVDSLADEDEYEDLDEKISAYRCTCRESSLGK